MINSYLDGTVNIAVLSMTQFNASLIGQLLNSSTLKTHLSQRTTLMSTRNVFSLDPKRTLHSVVKRVR